MERMSRRIKILRWFDGEEDFGEILDYLQFLWDRDGCLSGADIVDAFRLVYTTPAVSYDDDFLLFPDGWSINVSTPEGLYTVMLPSEE